MRVLLVSEGKHEESGALESLVLRTATKIQACEFAKVSRDDIHTHRGKGQGFTKRALRWLLEARKRNFDALVLVVDEDGCSERIRELTEAQNHQLVAANFPRALGIAIRSFDAWMLADEKALSVVLGCVVPTQSSPEEQRDPKSRCSALLADRSSPFSQSGFYARVAEVVDLEQLMNGCPKGFGVFAARLKSL